MAEQEQTAVLDAEQTPVEPVEQTTPVAEATVDAGAEAAEGGAEAAAEYDLSTQEGIIALRQSNPAFDAYVKQQADSAFDAGRQKRDKELRLERGTEDVSRAAMDALSKKYGFELDEADKNDLPLWVKANRTAERVSAAQTVIFKALDPLGVSDDEKALYREQIEAMADEPDRLEGIAAQVLALGAERTANERIGTLTLDEVPKDSRLHASIQAHIASELEKELGARAAEKDPVENPPRTPRGTAPAGGTERYANMTPQEIASLPAEEWREYTRVLSGVS